MANAYFHTVPNPAIARLLAAWTALTMEERCMAIVLCSSNNRMVPALVRYRLACRDGKVAQRIYLGPDGNRQAFMRYLFTSGRLNDGLRDAQQDGAH